VTDGIRRWSNAGRVTWIERSFDPGDVKGRTLVFSATGDTTVDKAVSSTARKENVPVGVVDTPDLSDFIMPAIVDRSPVVITVSSGGAAPVLAHQIRATMEALLPASLGRLARAADDLRAQVREAIPSIDARRSFWTGYFRN